MVKTVGFEPTAYTLEACCSSNWAMSSKIINGASVENWTQF